LNLTESGSLPDFVEISGRTAERRQVTQVVVSEQVRKSRDGCQAFEPLVPEFIDVLLNPGPYLRQIQRFARRMNPALALSDRS
ncbi:MAG: hypothetical protein ACK57O_05550, partial [Planctomyces sp.]